MLGDKPGLLAIFDDSGPVYTASSTNIARDTRVFLAGGSASEFRTLLAIQDLRASPRNAEARAKSGPLAVRLNKRVAKLSYRVAAAPTPMLVALAEGVHCSRGPPFERPDCSS